MNPILGILLHAVGGFAAGSFYLPLKKVKEWAWESYWLVNGFVSWMLMPWIVATLTVPQLLSLLGGSVWDDPFLTLLLRPPVVEHEGALKLVMAEGQSVEGPILEIGNTNSRYSFPIGAKSFVETWNSQGPAHHCAVGMGHIASKLTKLAQLLEIEAVQIC